MEVTTEITRKSLHTRIEEAAAARNLKVAAGAFDGRLTYTVVNLETSLPVLYLATPGQVADYLGIPVLA